MACSTKLTDEQISQILALFDDEYDVKEKYKRLLCERMNVRKFNFLIAVIELSIIEGVTFPNLSIEVIEHGDIATTIQIGVKYTRELYGRYHDGYVASLEDEYDEYDEPTMCFKSFEDLVKYVKIIADKQALTAAKSS